MIQENYEDDNLIINILVADVEKDILIILKWLSKKKNIYTLYNSKITNKGKPLQDVEYIETQLLALYQLIPLPFLYLMNDIYLIILFNKNKEIFILKVNFKKSIKRMLSIKKFIDNNKVLSNISRYIDMIDEIYLYEPFKVGNIFSKKRYRYEINLFYMDALKSYRSSDRDRSTLLKNKTINANHAILNEYYSNIADNYNEDYAYIDFFDMYFQDEFTMVYYLEKYSIDTIFKVLNIIDEIYCLSILNQQNDIKKIIENNVRVPENEHIKGSIYSFKEFVINFRKEIYQERSKYNYEIFKQLMIYLKTAQKKSINSYKHLWKKESLTTIEKIFFDNIVSKFPEYTRDDYYHMLQNNINKLIDKEVSIKIANQIFGKNSCFYETKYKKNFRDIENLFSIYHDLNEDSKSIKYFFNSSWKDIVIEMKKKFIK